ncbi:MAG: folylpolyglutamate synthase/dihydrofolate synthase family protein [Pyrinomonadaceae bacterium]
MNFDESIQYLFSLGHETLALKLGLRNTQLLLESLGNPHEFFESVQIAGTNGKGSTAVVLDSICRDGGIKTGLFTSPHLISITERIRIDGNEISEISFAKHASEVRLAAESLVTTGQLEAMPTFFEHATAIALVAFREAEISLAILETGLGGRLDATTVAGARTVAITPLALDHQEHLGETLEEIAGEKAAIIRRGVAAVVAEQHPTALNVILRRCAECNVEPSVGECRIAIVDSTQDGRFRVTFETPEGRYENVLLGLRGRHQILNNAVAIRLAESLRKRGFTIPKTSIVKGIEKAGHAGRLELLEGNPSLLFDGAHNPSGAQALREFLDEFVDTPVTLLFSVMRDKKLKEIAAILFPVAGNLILTQPDNPRAARVEDLYCLAEKILDREKIIVAQSASQAFGMAKEVTPAEGIICITGSLYLVGEVKAIMNLSSFSKMAH